MKDTMKKRLMLLMAEGLDPALFGGGSGGGVHVADTDPDAPQEGITLDDLFTQEVDMAAAEDVLRRALAPMGTYQTDPGENGPMNVNITAFEEKDADENVTGKRLMVTVTGRGTAKIKGAVVNAGLRVRLSPDARKSAEYIDGERTGNLTEKDDSATKLWAQACASYKAHFGEAPKNRGAVVEYLRDYPVRFRLIQTGVPSKNFPDPKGEPGNMVVAISSVREKK